MVLNDRNSRVSVFRRVRRERRFGGLEMDGATFASNDHAVEAQPASPRLSDASLGSILVTLAMGSSLKRSKSPLSILPPEILREHIARRVATIFKQDLEERGLLTPVQASGMISPRLQPPPVLSSRKSRQTELVATRPRRPQHDAETPFTVLRASATGRPSMVDLCHDTDSLLLDLQALWASPRLLRELETDQRALPGKSASRPAVALHAW